MKLTYSIIKRKCLCHVRQQPCVLCKEIAPALWTLNARTLLTEPLCLQSAIGAHAEQDAGQVRSFDNGKWQREGMEAQLWIHVFMTNKTWLIGPRDHAGFHWSYNWAHIQSQWETAFPFTVQVQRTFQMISKWKRNSYCSVITWPQWSTSALGQMHYSSFQNAIVFPLEKEKGHIVFVCQNVPVAMSFFFFLND